MQLLRDRDSIREIGHDLSRLSGYAPALPTPFDSAGALDVTAFAKFCERQMQEGATALVVCGTTGEAPTLTAAEHTTLIRTAADVARGRIPVVAGAGSNSTAYAIELTRHAESAGADAVLSVVPYYNKPTQQGLEAHFTCIAQSTALPIILYDVPSRTGCGLADETILRLAATPLIIGLKDATGDIGRPLRLRAAVGPNFRLLSGDDATALAFLANGGDGCISVTSNFAPGLCRTMFEAYRRGETSTAQRWAVPLTRLTSVLFRETSPAPLKYALSLLGLMTSTVRLPLVEMTEPAKAEVDRAVEQFCTDFPEFVVGNRTTPAPQGTGTPAVRLLRRALAAAAR
jgi:4-hydroxy-tetrahydrodipicolinate synthase